MVIVVFGASVILSRIYEMLLRYRVLSPW